MTTARALAKATGAAQRTSELVNALPKLCEFDPVVLRQAWAVVEELDLLRFRLRDATLRSVIGPPLPAIASRIVKAPRKSQRVGKAKQKVKRR
jgi:hypothetical protein